jgi:hypothetical protein
MSNILLPIWFVANYLAVNGPLESLSLILAKILATYGQPNPTPKNWLANFGKAACGHKPNRPLYAACN